MAYTEMEEYLAGMGEEKALWIFSYKNVAGLVVGVFLGQRLGTLLFGTGLAGLLTTLLCAGVGIGLTLQVHGILFARRLLIRARFYLRRAAGPRIVDGTRYAEERPEHEKRVRVRRRMDNRPLIGSRSVPGNTSTRPLATRAVPTAEQDAV